MNDYPYGMENYSFSSDENDVFDENLDLFDHQQYGVYEDGINQSENVDENELDEELDESEEQLYIDYDTEDTQPSSDVLSEIEDYDDLDDDDDLID